MRKNQVTNSAYEKPQISVLYAVTESLILAGSPGSGGHGGGGSGGTVPHGAKVGVLDSGDEEESSLWDD